MIRSMTGYGRAQEEINGRNITVEVKSVNHRYFEFSARVPRTYGFLEEKLKSFFQSCISRGKVECYIQIETLEGEEASVEVNHSLASGYMKAFQELAARYQIENDIAVSDLARYTDVLSIHKAEQDMDLLWADVAAVARKAADSFVAMREREGEKLREDISSRLDGILRCVSFVEERSPQTVKEYNEKLVARMQELLDSVHVDEQRLLTEAAIYADKVAVAEETVRLRSHMDQMREFLQAQAAIGRKMDFLVQEINREANTIGSKAQDVEIARKVVDIKAEVEKIREQVQNIE